MWKPGTIVKVYSQIDKKEVLARVWTIWGFWLASFGTSLDYIEGISERQREHFLELPEGCLLSKSITKKQVRENYCGGDEEENTDDQIAKIALEKDDVEDPYYY